MKQRYVFFGLTGLLHGVLFACLLTVTGPRFAHFLLVPSLLQVGYQGLIGAVLFVGVAWMTEGLARRTTGVLCAMLSATNFIVWSSSFSLYVYWGWTWVLGLTVGGIVFVAGSFVLSYQFVSNPRSRRSQAILVLVVLLLAGRLALVWTPVGWVNSLVVFQHKESPALTNLRWGLYPSSQPLDLQVRTAGTSLFGAPGEKRIFTVVLDAFREDYFGKSLSGMNLTRNLEELARGNAYSSSYRVQAPRSKASVASFFTGKYLREHGTHDFGLVEEFTSDTIPGPLEATDDDYYGHALPGKFDTLAERLRDVGYRNAGFLTIGHLSPEYNYDQGFNEYVMTRGRGVDQDLFLLRQLIFWLLRTDPARSFVYMHFHGAHFPYYQGKQNTRFWRKTPYFRDGKIRFDWGLKPLMELVQRPHSEPAIENHPEERDFLRHLYGSSIHYYDQFVVPKLIKALKLLGTYRDSMFIVTADHGENLFDEQGFYGHGYTLGEFVINVPLLIKMPSSSVDRRESTHNLPGHLETIDLTATLLDYAGASREGISGTSFLPLLEKRSDTVPGEGLVESFSEQPAKSGGIKSVAVVRNDCKYIYDYERGSGRFEWDCEAGPSSREGVLRDRIFERLGSDGTLADTSAPYVGIPENQARDLKGLGYF